MLCSPRFGQAQNVVPSVRDDSSAVRAAKKKASPRSVMFRSVIVPGWGQYYNRQYLKAALVFSAEVGLITTSFYWNQKIKSTDDPDLKLFYKNNRNTANWFLLGTVLLSMLDAYVDASLADFDESPDLSLAPLPQFADRSPAVKVTIKIGL
jgi:hypothetical protein